MKMTGHFFDVEGMDEWHVAVDDAIVTNKKISLDWEDDGYKYNAILTSEDGTQYCGTFGSPRPMPKNTMKARRYKSTNGDELLWMTWYSDETKNESTCIVHLSAEWS
jgi:hypothetical protein